MDITRERAVYISERNRQKYNNIIRNRIYKREQNESRHLKK